MFFLIKPGIKLVLFPVYETPKEITKDQNSDATKQENHYSGSWATSLVDTRAEALRSKGMGFVMENKTHVGIFQTWHYMIGKEGKVKECWTLG